MLSSDELGFLDDESDKLGSDSGSYGTYYFCAFYLCAEDSVAGVLGYGVFVQVGYDYFAGAFASEVFAPTGVKPKGGRLLVIFWALKLKISPPNFKMNFIVIV